MITLYIIGALLLIFLWYILTPRKKNDEGFKLWSFKANSWHARYYKYIVSENLPQGGCEYFWSILGLTVFASVIFFFIGLFKVIMLIGSYFPERPEKQRTPEQWQQYWKKKEKREQNQKKVASIAGKVFLGLLGLLVLFGIYKLFFLKGPQWLSILQVVGMLVGTVAVIAGIIWLFEKFSLGKLILKGLRPLGYPFVYFWSMIVAIYTKSCPKITWNYGEQLPAEAETKNVDEQSVL